MDQIAYKFLDSSWAQTNLQSQITTRSNQSIYIYIYIYNNLKCSIIVAMLQLNHISVMLSFIFFFHFYFLIYLLTFMEPLFKFRFYSVKCYYLHMPLYGILIVTNRLQPPHLSYFFSLYIFNCSLHKLIGMVFNGIIYWVFFPFF